MSMLYVSALPSRPVDRRGSAGAMWKLLVSDCEGQQLRERRRRGHVMEFLAELQWTRAVGGFEADPSAFRRQGRVDWGRGQAGSPAVERVDRHDPSDDGIVSHEKRLLSLAGVATFH